MELRQRLDADRRRLLRLVLGANLLLLAVLLGVLWASWERNRAGVNQVLQTQAAFWAEAIQGRYDLLQATCDAAQSDVEDDPALLRGGGSTERWLSLLRERLSFVDTVHLIGVNGQVIAGAGPHAAKPGALRHVHDREDFRRAQDMGGDLLIGRPALDANLPGQTVSPVRCFLHAGSDDQAMLVLSIPTGRLLGALRQGLQAAQEGELARWVPAVGLLRNDGYLLGRLPAPNPEQLAALVKKPARGALARELAARPDQPRGLFDGAVQAVGGQRLIGAWQRLQRHPVTAFVSLPHDVLLGLFLRQMWPLVVGWVLLVLTQLVAGWWIARMIRHQHYAARLNALLAATSQAAGQATSEAELFRAICDGAVARGRVALAWVARPRENGPPQVFAQAAREPRFDVLGAAPEACAAELLQLLCAEGCPGYVSWPPRQPPSERAAARLHALGLRSAAALPLHRAGHADARLVLHWHNSHRWPPELKALLRQVADSVSRGLERLDLIEDQRLEQEERQRQQELLRSVLNQIDTLIAARSSGEVLESVCGRLLETGLFAAVWVAGDDGRGQAQVLAAGGDGAATLAAHPPLQMAAPADHALARAWRSEMEAMDTVVSSPLISPWKDYAIPGWTQGALALPLRRDDKRWAVLVLVLQNRDDLHGELHALVQRVAVLVERALAEIDLKAALEAEQERQRHLARHDALTGLPNRLALEQHLPLAMARTRRAGDVLAVGVLDLDDFKPVNDTHGHAAGDRLLQQLALRLRDAVRETDLVARLGGDEFVIVLEGLNDARHLPAVLDRLHTAVEVPFDLGEGAIAKVGMSLGLTLYPQDDGDADLLLRHADAALYASKLNKAERTNWWQLWGEGLGQTGADAFAAAPRDIDPYGAEAQRLLALSGEMLQRYVRDYVQRFFDELRVDPATAALVSALSVEEYARLRHAQEVHLLQVLGSQCGADEHAQLAQRVGEVHALVGVDPGALVTQTGWLLRGVQQVGDHAPLRRPDRAALTFVLTARLQRELQWQSLGAERVRERYQSMHYALEQMLPDLTQWADLARTVLDAIATLPGMAATVVYKPDADGRFVPEFSAGRFESYLDEIEQRQIAPLLLGNDGPFSATPHARCWRSEQIETNASYVSDARMAPWRQAAHAAGIRSSAAIPLKDAKGRMFAVIGLYGDYPAMFESRPMHSFLRAIEQVFERGVQTLQSGRVAALTPAQDRRLWRQQLFSGGLELHYQPVVDLRSGRPAVMEALARLRLPDGTLISPGRFLPSFGVAELTRLFTLGLEKALDQMLLWDSVGQSLDVALNLPTEVLVMPDCPAWVRDALARRRIDPARLRLELLEDADVQSDAQRDAAVRALAATGVKLAMDDLGSGYSSLLRLRTLPFHTVKIDQGLVRELPQDDNPRVLDFIGALVSMTQTLGMVVVVEGLETEALVEVAAVLGADAGQGYALARPMPSAEVLPWLRGFTLTVQPGKPRTALGREAQQRRRPRAAAAA